MRLPLLLLLFACLASAEEFFSGTPVEPKEAVIDQVTIFMQLLLPLMFALVAIAVAVYAAGQMFGAETRAKATVWAHGVLIAVGLSAMIIIAIYVILPNFFQGSVCVNPGATDCPVDLVQKIYDLRETAATFLAALTLILVVLAGAVYAAGMMSDAQTRAKAANWASGLISGAVFAAVVYVLLSELLPQIGSAFFGPLGLGIYGQVIIQLVAFIAFFILITYLITKVFKVPEWEAYLNIEMSSLINSFLVALFMVALFGVGSATVMLWTSGTYTSPPQAAISYMQATVVDSILMATMDVYKIQACTSILSTIARRIGEFVLTQTYKVFPGMDTFVSITNVLTFTLLALYNTAKVQVILLYVVDALMVPFFLPAGLILRFFPPTRDAGSFLIALAFGLQVVFPGTYLLNKAIFTEIGAHAYNEPGQRPTLLIHSLCGPFKYGVAGFLFNPSANPIFGMFPGGAVVGNALSKIVSEGLLNAISMAEFIPILRHIGSLSLLSLFMPALSMMLTIAFINSMAKFLVLKV